MGQHHQIVEDSLNGYAAASLYGDQTNDKRAAAMTYFRNRRVMTLVATDVLLPTIGPSVEPLVCLFTSAAKLWQCACLQHRVSCVCTWVIYVTTGSITIVLCRQ
jgi:hypothetical protein